MKIIQRTFSITDKQLRQIEKEAKKPEFLKRSRVLRAAIDLYFSTKRNRYNENGNY